VGVRGALYLYAATIMCLIDGRSVRLAIPVHPKSPAVTWPSNWMSCSIPKINFRRIAIRKPTAWDSVRLSPSVLPVESTRYSPAKGASASHCFRHI
jgi:hypothetical protein